MNIILLALALAPVLVILVYIYHRDRFQKEPWWLLLLTFIGGIFSIYILSLLKLFLPETISESHFWQSFYTAFIQAGLLEELSKFIILIAITWQCKHFDEYFDGIIYAVFASMGFAAFENISYVAMYGGSVSFGRAMLAIPAHFLFALSMGYFFSLAKFFPKKRTRNLLLCIFVPALLHGCYDFPLMLIEGEISTLVSTLLTTFFFAFDILLWIIGVRRLKRVKTMSDYETGE